MNITHVFAGIAVSDFGSARDWYERLFGRPPNVVPKQDEGVWHLTSTSSIYVVQDGTRAGRSLLTLAVDDLDEHLAELAERGLRAGRIDTVPGVTRKAVVIDPDGNAITFFENLSAAGR
jgi:predicted enzyme related to lactoylglutathione lyase